jgi:hypothetical protein
VIGSLIMAAAYGLWRTHQIEGMRLSKKIELRNKLTLASKRLQRAVTLAGIGLSGAANLGKQDAIGSDTLVIFTNPAEAKAGLAFPSDHHVAAIQVDVAGPFSAGGYVALVGGGHAELRRIVSVTGSSLSLDSAFANDYPAPGTAVLPARRERFYSQQDSLRLIHETPEGLQILATEITNFQVSFADQQGHPTEAPTRVRTVRYSLTGIFPARKGALNSIILSSTAIPRNTL